LRAGSELEIHPRALRFFNDAQARVITATAERMFPRDDAGPGATDAHVLDYIDGRLVSAWGGGRIGKAPSSRHRTAATACRRR
jgi:hypothetical protein